MVVHVNDPLFFIFSNSVKLNIFFLNSLSEYICSVNHFSSFYFIRSLKDRNICVVVFQKRFFFDQNIVI